GLDFLVVEEGASTRLQQAEMTIHRVLIEWNEHVDLVTHVAHGRIAGANGEESMPTPNNGLVGVVGVEMQAAPGKDAGQDVSRGRDALTVLATYSNCEVKCSHIARIG